MKPGYKTTEFWLALAACLVGFAMASGAFHDSGALMRGLGLIAASLSSAGYSHSRGHAKAGD